MIKSSPLLSIIPLLVLLGASEARALPMDFGGWTPGPFSCAMEDAIAADPSLAAKQAEFVQLCSRDPDCWHLKAHHAGMSELVELRDVGSVSRSIRCAPFKEPSPVLTDYLKRFAGDFWDAARLYDVPETALIGAILAENSLNVSLDDQIQDLIADRSGGSLSVGSIGFGQIFSKRALGVERMAAWIEGRPLRNEVEITRALLTERGSILYAAAILRDAWKTYARFGIDIRENVPVLVTLYNIGKVDEHAHASRVSGREPRENYLGFFVRENVSLIESIRLFPSECVP